MKTRTFFVRSALVLAVTVGGISLPSTSQASTSYCGHGTDGWWYNHDFLAHTQYFNPVVTHNVGGWSPLAQGSGGRYYDHYDSVGCYS